MKDLARHLVRAGASNKRRQETMPPAPKLPAEVVTPLDSWQEQEEDKPPSRGGRPRTPVDKAHGYRVAVFLRDEEKRDLDRYVRKHKYRSVSEAIRSMLVASMKGPPPPPAY